MSADVLVVKNDPNQGSGVLQEVLEAHGISYDTIEYDADYPSPANYGAMFAFGSYNSVNDDTPVVRKALSNVSIALEQEVPYFGTCFGMQALAKLSGGSVFRENKFKEIAFEDAGRRIYNIELTPSGKEDPLFSGLPEQLKTFRLHYEGASLGPDAVLLGDRQGLPGASHKGWR